MLLFGDPSCQGQKKSQWSFWKSDPLFGKSQHSARAGGAQELLAFSVNKVWLRKLNEITGVILKEQITLKGFR